MSEVGLIRMYIIISELSVIAFNKSNFATYQYWFKYYKQMITTPYLLKNNLNIINILIHLEEIYGIEYNELFNFICDFFDADNTLDMYNFTKYTYINHVT